jgi:hypothetical protein
MKTIEVKKDNVSCNKDMAEDYILTLNGIVFDCANSHLGTYRGFREGTRNTVAVDLTVCATMLGLDPEVVLDELTDLDVIDPTDDDEDTFERVKTVSDYKDRFSWDWMIDPSYYYNLAAAALPVFTDGEESGGKIVRIPIYFKLV